MCVCVCGFKKSKARVCMLKTYGRCTIVDFSGKRRALADLVVEVDVAFCRVGKVSMAIVNIGY